MNCFLRINELHVSASINAWKSKQVKAAMFDAKRRTLGIHRIQAMKHASEKIYPDFRAESEVI